MFFNLSYISPLKEVCSKKFVLYCNRYTVVTWFFNFKFVRIYKKRYNLVDNQKRIVWTSYFFCLRLTWKEFQLSKTVQKKGKTKWKRATRKGHRIFSVFHFGELKLLPTNSALISSSNVLTRFFQKCGRGIKKSSIIW